MIAVVGHSVLDRTMWPDGQIRERLGGAPIFAAQALRDTWPAMIITRGDYPPHIGRLYGFGPYVTAGPRARGTVFEVSLVGDGTWAESIIQLGDPFSRDDVDGWMAPALDRCSTVVCGTQWRGDFRLEAIAALASGGRRVFLDGQGMARPARLGGIRLEGPFDSDIGGCVDVLKLSACEADALLGGADLEAAATTGIPVVVVTLAERGAIVLADGQTTHVDVDPVLGLTDTVGAGDAFLALMAAASDVGADPVDAAQAACNATAALLRRRLAVELAWQSGRQSAASQ